MYYERFSKDAPGELYIIGNLRNTQLNYDAYLLWWNDRVIKHGKSYADSTVKGRAHNRHEQDGTV